jgi:protein-S-isoprenylcysteine O-methyltransferase Ste14
LCFVVPLLIGLRLDPLVPSSVPWLGLDRFILFAGSGLVALGAVIAMSAVGCFAFRRTTIVPHRSAKSLVVTGPFRVSRNPMYVALTAVYVGVAVIYASWATLVLLAVPLLVLQLVVIPMEESSLLRLFGAEYAAYAGRVRRWI